MTGDGVGDPTISDLWRLLDELHETGFSHDPRDLTNNLGLLSGIIERAWLIAREPPPVTVGVATRDRLATSCGDVDLVDRARRSLSHYGCEIAAARRRHGEMSGHLRAAAERLHPCEPRRIGQVLDDVVAQIAEGIGAAIDAYSRAEAAARECEATLGAGADRMPPPPHQAEPTGR